MMTKNTMSHLAVQTNTTNLTTNLRARRTMVRLVGGVLRMSLDIARLANAAVV